MIIMSVSIISMVIFACGEDAKKRADVKGSGVGCGGG
jgi:hypothetical protein